MKTLILTLVLCLCATTAFAGKTHKYRCAKCGLVQEYTVPGTKKCPNDGRTMIRVN